MGVFFFQKKVINLQPNCFDNEGGNCRIIRLKPLLVNKSDIKIEKLLLI